MSTDRRLRDHVSSVFTTFKTINCSQRQPLAPRSVNLSNLVEAQKSHQHDSCEISTTINQSSLSDLIVKSQIPISRQEHCLRSVAGLLSEDRTLQFAKSRSRSRPRKKIQQSASDSRGLAHRVSKSVNAFETKLRLQRHRSTPVQFDIFLYARSTKPLSPTEIMVVTEDSNNQNVLILHSHISSDISKRRGPLKLLLSSQSSLTLYPGLKWYFEWQVL
ncbi:LAME_0F04082g1_1 [Lachancea meyersii CBS 8951]|uniref:LAME_0F04082g1_1 n=1 Tax=Lachancea meyersii CBS 8951 TaxID=1266667 RepID=A0A1G4JRP9_9SACH|nr:LAME_0F04082g1_1 [Lachancea meyersii CBS 8951]